MVSSVNDVNKTYLCHIIGLEIKMKSDGDHRIRPEFMLKGTNFVVIFLILRIIAGTIGYTAKIANTRASNVKTNRACLLSDKKEVLVDWEDFLGCVAVEYPGALLCPYVCQVNVDEVYYVHALCILMHEFLIGNY